MPELLFLWPFFCLLSGLKCIFLLRHGIRLDDWRWDQVFQYLCCWVYWSRFNSWICLERRTSFGQELWGYYILLIDMCIVHCVFCQSLIPKNLLCLVSLILVFLLWQMNRFVVHGFRRKKNPHSPWVLSSYTFGHENLQTCETWAECLNACIDMEVGRPKSLLVQSVHCLWIYFVLESLGFPKLGFPSS